MSIKNILISEPTNPVLRQLAVRFMHAPDARLLCFDKGESGGEEGPLEMLFSREQGHLRPRDCSEMSVDEIWHMVNPADSIEECRKKTEGVLRFATRHKPLVLHYLSASTIATSGTEPLFDSMPQSSNQERMQLFLNTTAVEQSGCKFRIYRIPLTPEILFHPASGWTQFIQYLNRFKIEIEDRIPGYFTAQPLRLYLAKSGTIDIARTDDIVETLEQILSSGVDGTCFHLHTPRPLLVEECLQMLAEFAGIHLRIVASREQQNYVDRLFGSRMGKLLTYLEHSAQVTTEMVVENSPGEQISFSVPSIPLQGLIAAYHSKSHGSTRQPGDWKAGLEQKQIALPDGNVLNYYIGGKGQKTVALLNAYGQSFGYWERFIQTVSPQFRIILWMPRGNGGDTIGLKIASPQGVHADDLEQVLRQEKIESCALLAWCSGPRLALEYYQRYPDRISSMVFLAASFKGPRQYKTLETEYEKNLEPLLEAIEKYPETAEVVLEYLKGILLAQGKQARSIDELAALSDHDLQQALSAVNVSLQDLVLHPFHGPNVVAYARQMCDFWKYDFVTGLDRVKVPVLFVGGDCDRIASQAIAEAVAGMMPRARYLKIKGGTHYIHYDRWDLLAEITGHMVNSGGRLEFSAPWAAASEVNHESVAARQS